jgi:hypothetical protein
MYLNRFFTGPERTFLLLVIFISFLWPIVAVMKKVEINMVLTAPAIGLEILLILVGVYLRIRLNWEAVAKLFIALSFFMSVLRCVSNLISLRFPLDGLWLDHVLQATDDAIGYSWIGFVEWMSMNPGVANYLALTYHTSLPQLTILITFLALTRRDNTLYRFLTCAAISLFITVSIWMIWPSFGPAINATIPKEFEESFNMIVNSGFQVQMLKNIENGVDSVPPTTTLGLVAFPSFHTIMTLLVIVYAWGTPLRWPFFIFNLAMWPAILGQGAHYVADVVAGFVVFWIGAMCARTVINGSELWPKLGTQTE